MKVELISTGDEVMEGFIDDTNSSWISRRLIDRGIEVSRRSSTGDDREAISAVIKECSGRADVVIVNGGLGPTTDDLTTEAAAAAAGVPVVRNSAWESRIRDWFAARNRTMTDNNLKQADLPEGAEVIDNPAGTACGYQMRINGTEFFFTPGVPSEFKRMCDDHILPAIFSNVPDDTVILRYFLLGIGESSIGKRLSGISWPEGITIGYRAFFPYLEIKITARKTGASELSAAETMLLREISPWLVGRKQLDMAGNISKLSGVIPLQVLEYGTRGRLIREIAGAMESVSCRLKPLPETAHDLLAYIKPERCRTIAVGRETENGIPVAYWGGLRGFAVTIRMPGRDHERFLDFAAAAALDMLQRALSGHRPDDGPPNRPCEFRPRLPRRREADRDPDPRALEAG